MIRLNPVRCVLLFGVVIAPLFAGAAAAEKATAEFARRDPVVLCAAGEGRGAGGGEYLQPPRGADHPLAVLR